MQNLYLADEIWTELRDRLVWSLTFCWPPEDQADEILMDQARSKADEQMCAICVMPESMRPYEATAA